MLMKKTLGTAVLVAGLLTSPLILAKDVETFNAAYTAADAARKAAGKLGYEWKETRDILKEAYALAEAGNLTEAVALANVARMQGEAAQAQAKEQEARWRSFVVR